MSRASCPFTCIEGIVACGSTLRGSRMRRTLCASVLGTAPAIGSRCAMPPGGGPTCTSEPVMPGTL